MKFHTLYIYNPQNQIREGKEKEKDHIHYNAN